MLNSSEQIKEKLEDTYDIPFTVTENFENGEPCYFMGPENSEKQYFNVKVYFSNEIRVTTEFIPEKFGGLFVRRMGEHSDSDRENFLRFKDIMQDRGAKVSISINNKDLSWEGFKKFREPWNQLKVRATKIPITDEVNFSHYAVALEWGSLMTGMILSLADIVPLDYKGFSPEEGYAEGSKSKVLTNKYERNPINRKLCLEKNGYTCCVCGMNFKQSYGEIGNDFIHVHHVIPVSQLGEDYVIDPLRDLVPVCPNCHAMLHKKDPPYAPDELKEILQNQIR